MVEKFPNFTISNYCVQTGDRLEDSEILKLRNLCKMQNQQKNGLSYIFLMSQLAFNASG